MACEDCDQARRNSVYRVYTPKCLWCGARYLQSLKSWPAPRDMNGRPETTAERKEWRAQVLRDWVAWGHDRAQLEDLAAAEAVPFEPVEARSAEAATPAADGQRPERARALARKASKGEGGARGRRVGAEGKAGA